MRVLPALFLLAACLGGPTEFRLPEPPTGPGLHVLFVGNSLTYFNSLPKILEALADSAGEPLLETAEVTFPDYSLEDHWADGRATATLGRPGWHRVVLQQGPSSLEANRALLIQYAQKFDSVARISGARSALYMVWPTVDRPGDFERASESYRLAAAAVDGLLFPVGDAWREAARPDETIPLYASDGLHPTVAGSYLAALVMFAVLYQKTPLGLPGALRLRDGRLLVIDPALATTLQQAAATATSPPAPRKR
jgi:hypothetical protein